MHRIVSPEPIVIDPHFTPQFYSELAGVSVTTVIRWFQDRKGVFKVSMPAKNGKPSRVELRIPWSVWMQFYQERTQGAVE